MTASGPAARPGGTGTDVGLPARDGPRRRASRWRSAVRDLPRGRLAYLLLSVATVALVAGQDLNEQWSGDLWLHAAAVRELASRPWSPLDPVLGVAADHPMLTPYAWVLGRVAAMTGFSALSTLKLAGLANVVVVLCGLRSFTLAVLAGTGTVRTKDPRHGPANDTRPDERAAAWALLFTLCLWGPSPWRWSGLLHLGALGFTAPYPSMLCTGATLLVLALALRRSRSGPGWWLAVVAVAVPFVALSHPPTAGALLIGLAATAVSRRRSLGATGLGLLALAVAAGVLVAWRWPFFPLFGLEPTPSFDAMHELIYQQTLVRVAPALLGLVLLGRRWWRRRDDPLALMAALALLAVAAGAATDALWLGRLLPFAVLCLHVALADGAVDLQRWAAARPGLAGAPSAAVVAGVVAAVGLWGLVNARAAVVRSLPRDLVPSSLRDDERLDAASATYGPLLAGVGADDVVVAPFADSRYTPAFAGRLAGSYWENNFVADDSARRARLAHAYSSSDELRRPALAGADWVVTSPEGRIDDALAADGWTQVRRVDDHALWRRP